MCESGLVGVYKELEVACPTVVIMDPWRVINLGRDIGAYYSVWCGEPMIHIRQMYLYDGTGCDIFKLYCYDMKICKLFNSGGNKYLIIKKRLALKVVRLRTIFSTIFSCCFIFADQG